MEEFLEGFDDNLDGNYIIILENTENDFEFTLENSLKFDVVPVENVENIVTVDNLTDICLPPPSPPKPVKSESEIKKEIETIYNKFHLDKSTIKVAPYKLEEIVESNEAQQPELSCYIRSKDERLRNRKITSLGDTLDEVRNAKQNDDCFVMIVEDQNVKLTKVVTSDRVKQETTRDDSNSMNDIVQKLSTNDVVVKPVKEEPEEAIINEFLDEMQPPSGVVIKTLDGAEYLFDNVTDALPKSENVIAKKAEQINLNENFKFEAKLSCDRCNYSTNSLENLKSHKVNHPPKKIFKCDTCTFNTPDLRALYRHMEEPKCKKIFSCDRCNFTCDKPPLLYQHKKSHPKIVKTNCNICLLNFDKETDLNDHKKVHVVDDYYKCEFCDYKSIVSQAMKAHRITHMDEKSFTCEVCGKKFRRFDILKTHKRIHTDDKPYACDLCEYRSRFRNNLYCHRKIHSEEKPYACHICTHQTKSLANLNAHKKTHLVEKALSCDTCEYKTHSTTHLRHHKKIHSAERSYACNFCDFKCKHPNSLVNHKRRSHKFLKTEDGELQTTDVDMIELNFYDQLKFVTNSIV